MNWLKEVSPDHIYNDYSHSIGELNIEFIKEHQIVKNTIVSDFFMLMDNRTAEGKSSIGLPVPNEKVYNQIIQEIAPYFKECSVEKINNIPDRISLQYLNELAQSTIHSGNHHQMFEELFPKNNKQIGKELFAPILNQRVYKVVPSHLKMIDDEELLKLFQFLEESYTIEKEFIFVPSPLELSEELKDKQFIRYAAYYCKAIYLWIDSDSNHIFQFHLKF